MEKRSKLRLWRLSLVAIAVAGLTACLNGSDPVVLPDPSKQESFLPPELPSGFTAKPIAFAGRDMVAAANPIAVQTGKDILAKGGSAVDAAIAVQLVLNLVEPQSSGIGGGAFMLHFDAANQSLIAYDGRETAPAAATPNQFLDASGKPLGFAVAVDGGLSVGTPGLLRMLELAHKKHGKLAWASLFEPAIKLADSGFAISPRMYAQVVGSAARLKSQEPAATYFLKPDGSAKDVGTVLKNPEYAQTLRIIAAQGAQAFYTGEIAQAVVDKVRNHPTNPGRLSMADMAGYQPKARAALCATYRVSYTVCGMPPPSSGALTMLQTLGILQNFDVAQYKPNSVDAVHLISEAYRLAYADRAQYIGDADFVAVPVAGLIDPAYLKSRAALIDMKQSMGVAKPGVPPGAKVGQGLDNSLNLPSTSHMSIIDSNGNAVSMTTTIENGFGSLQMVKGFLLNNQLTDFSFTPTDATGALVANRVEPGKRPRSAMAPTIIFNSAKEVEAVIGSPGGSNIIQYVTKVTVGLIDWKLDIQQAINLPNFGAQTSAVTSLEKGMPITAIEAALKARGHTVSVVDINSGLHGVTFNGVRADGKPGQLSRYPGLGTWAGGADPRREGVALGN